MYCVKCGTAIDDNAIACPKCGVPTKNFTRKKSAQTTVNVSGRAVPKQEPLPMLSEAWKIAVGLLIILFGASAYVESWRDWSWGALGAATLSILGGSILLAWGIVSLKASHQRQEQEEEVYL